MLKSIIKLFLKLLNKFFYKGFNVEDYSQWYLFKFALQQKFWGANRRIPWPVHRSSQIKAYRKIVRGTKAPGSGQRIYLDARNGIVFGKNVWLAAGVSIISMNHDLLDYEKYQKTDPVVIGDDCILGLNSIILPGVKLGSHVVVAAGAVVTKSFEENDLVIGGNPAKIIKKLEPYHGK